VRVAVGAADSGCCKTCLDTCLQQWVSIARGESCSGCCRQWVGVAVGAVDSGWVLHRVGIVGWVLQGEYCG